MKLVDKAVGAIRAGGKVAGLLAASAADVREVYDRGARFILTPVLQPLRIGSTEFLNAMRAL
jgi:2-keto-3-deoxy-L-rhamnonate aldolase RhmA